MSRVETTILYLLKHLQYFISLSILGLFFYLLQNEIVRYRSRVKNLPGPRGWPIVGNLFQHRDEIAAETYRKWSLKHGPVFQIQLGNTTAVVINSAQAARQLFLGQSSGMNSRPVFYVLHQKMSKVASIGTSPWDDSCKRRRKLAANALNHARVVTYSPILNFEAREFLRDLYSSCRDGSVEIDFQPAARRFALNLSLTLNYGTRVSSVKSLADDPILSSIAYIESEALRFRDTEKNYANYIPLLRYWEPMVQFLGLSAEPKGHVEEIGRRRLEYHRVLLEKLKGEVQRGEDKPCIQGAVLRDPESATLTQEELLSVSLSMMAGADSIQAAIGCGCLLLAHRPDIQEKAFSAIRDAGLPEQPPSAYASSKIEYIDALTKEISRYYTVSKLALPRATYTDVTWENATIPANTLVLLNAWACNRDPELFSEPDIFAPERWLPSSPNEYSHQFAFGIGGRMCAASNLVHKSLYTGFLHLLAHFRIVPAEGETIDAAHPINGSKGPSAMMAPRAWRARFLPREGERLAVWLEQPSG
ncbi:cytochrome P450 [Annulohypoxylon maeteangense]|uniref:cytochrome P450 n=1 Tax=Annulohypoxylon maeteangense TaxID=1927788 RepID=UPI002007A85A|nr:cytochrome P450 [Annulohypoxylon maeteangense]KAI0886558.1 cytochrome P450 [Annulohypoxylon maeteangense]